jgi:hypothetical protein
MKALSIVLCGRNDNYMGNYLYRLGTAINYLARNLEYAERAGSVEILVGDWNSDVPLAESLPLNAAARTITRFVQTSPALARAAQPAGRFFHNPLASNTALRRANGQFVMMTDADGLIPLHSLRSLFALLEGKSRLPVNLNETFFIADRRHVPWEVVQRQPTLDGWDEYLLTHGGDLPVDRGAPGLGICQNAWLAHRDIWQACRGLNEQMHYWGWTDAELTLRMNQRHPSIQLAGLGVVIYHMEHWPRNKRSPFPQCNPHIVTKTFASNDAGWGLGDSRLEIVSPPAAHPLQGADFAVPNRKERCDISILKRSFRDRRVRETVKSAMRSYRGLKIERTALELLASRSLRHESSVYLEFGASIGRSSTAVVATLNPAADIYAIDDWGEKDERSCLPNEYADVLRDVASAGQLRFVAGEMRTGLQRLENSVIGKLEVDLAVFRERLFPTGALEALRELLGRLSPAGAVICVAENPQFQKAMKPAVEEGQHSLAVFGVDRAVSMICSAR